MNTLSGVAVLLEQDEKVLLTLRKAGENTGAWELPAGHIKDGETPEETTVREAYEETGLRISNLTLIGTITDLKNQPITYIYEATISDGILENREPDQHEQVAWVPLRQLPENLGPSAAYILKRQQ